MTDPAATTPAASTESCSAASCCKSPCDCPCAARLCKLEKSVRRIRIALWISLGVFIFVLGIAIGSGGAKKEMMEHMRMMDAHRAAGQPGPQGPGPMMNGGPGPQGPTGPGPNRQPEPRRDERRR